jgi:hypothetical protein
VNGVSRLYIDREILCWEGLHNTMAFGVALPSIIIWSFGIPFFFMRHLNSIQKDLSNIDNKEKLGFLYQGYNPHKYYWYVHWIIV